MGFKHNGPGCCGCVVNTTTVTVAPSAPCSPYGGGGFGGWDSYLLGAAVKSALSAVITDPDGTVVATILSTSSTKTATFTPTTFGTYHIVIAGGSTFSITTAGTPHPSVTFDPDTVSYDFDIPAPGTYTFPFAGPAMSSFTLRTLFTFPGFSIPSTAFVGGCGGLACCDYAPGGVTLSDQTFTAAITWGTNSAGFSYTYSPSTGVGAFTPAGGNVVLTSSDGADQTITGTIVYSCVLDHTYTVTTDFTLNFCDGPFPTVSTAKGPCV